MEGVGWRGVGCTIPNDTDDRINTRTCTTQQGIHVYIHVPPGNWGSTNVPSKFLM